MGARIHDGSVKEWIVEKDPLRDLRNRNLRNIALITVLVIIGLIIFQSWFGGNKALQEVNYSLFRSMVGNGQVASISIKDNQGTGVMTDGSKFTVELPDDKTLYEPFLRDNNVQIKYEPPSNNGWLLSVLMSILPIGLLVVVWIYIMRKTQGGGAMQFGQSKAKLVRPETTQVTFADVAG
ncbi:MAG TPA: hypothetical protein ENF88_00070, partial [Candidatus Acetothermia bacterium]|nr:hypothetical protein [Candidatus Acetothermia bacterium]HEX32071.1 hypothetical protein [Candidatus Acetothermia bacterium]